MEPSISPIITEKATILSEQNKTVFKVHAKANKKIIKKNIEKLFKVSVTKVNIINRKPKNKIKQGKRSVKSGYKKAYQKYTNDFLENLRMKCMQYKIDWVEVDINEGFEQILTSYLLKRQKMF